MKKVWKKLLELFTRTLKVAEEHKQMNLIQSIGKDDNGYATIDAVPTGSEQTCLFYPHQIINEPCIRKQFIPSDLKLLKGMLTVEGDIFIESKEYHEDTEIYSLRSLLNNQEWKLTRNQIQADKEILNRLNKRFFNHTLHEKLLSI